MPKVKKKQVLTGRTYRIDLRKVRCGQCRKKIGDHASFLLGHVVNSDTGQHGHIPLCGPCFTRSSMEGIGDAMNAIRAVIVQAGPQPEPLPVVKPERPN